MILQSCTFAKELNLKRVENLIKIDISQFEKTADEAKILKIMPFHLFCKIFQKRLYFFNCI
jgi:hypothetical protein